MKTILSKSSFFIPIVVLGMVACNNGTAGNTADSTVGNTMGDSVGSRMENATGSATSDVANATNGNDDSSFVSKAMASNNEELILIQAGIDKGTDSKLKAGARKMLADHTKLKTQLQSFASQKGYAAPTASDEGKSKDDLDKLNKNAKGKDWDKAWAEGMEKEHKDDISDFEKGERNVKDSSLHQIISNTLPVLHAHLSMAQELQKNIK